MITIIGAGISGLMMAEVLSANGMNYKIIEKKSFKQYCDSFKHNSVYYYHSNNINKILPIPLKKISIEKFFFDWNIHKYRNFNFRDLTQFTYNDSEVIANSSIENCGNSEYGYSEAFDNNFQKILFNRQSKNVEFENETFVSGKDNVVINTAPLNTFEHLFKDEIEVQLSREILKISSFKLDNTNFDKIMIVYSNDIFRRAIFFKNKVYIENLNEWTLPQDVITNLISIPSDFINIENKFVTYKFNKIDDIKRKNILFYLTSKHNIYSLGRYATWTYKRIDHIVDDALDIVKMIRFSRQGRW